MGRTILLSFVVLALLSGAVVQAATITVKADGTGDYPTIQTAINAAVPGDTVVLNPGVYQGNGNRDIDFYGKAITVTGTNPSDPCVVAATVIDCQGTQAQPHRGFNFHSGEGADSILDGLTITNGYGIYIPEYDSQAGGAISCVKSSPTIKNCLIKENRCPEDDPVGLGGGVYTRESNSVVVGCLFIENSAQYGGGMFNADSNSTIIDCQFISNHATGDRNGAGGGICNSWWRLRPKQRGEMAGQL